VKHWTCDKMQDASGVSALATQEGGGHYKDLAIQPVEYIHANGIGYFEGCVIKYVTRWKMKNGMEDLRKARHFIDLLLELEGKDAHREVPESRGVSSAGAGTYPQRDPYSEVPAVQGEAACGCATPGGGDPGITEYWLRCTESNELPVRVAGDVQAVPRAEGDSGVYVSDQAGVLSQ
jgi:hypothetical protein